MKRTLTNGFREIKDYLITWKSKQKLSDFFFYLSVILGGAIGVFLIFSLQLEGPLIAYIALCMFCASITFFCYIVVASIVYAFKNHRK